MQYLVLRDCAGCVLLQIDEEPNPSCIAQWPLDTRGKRNYVHTVLPYTIKDNLIYGDMFSNAAAYDYNIEDMESILHKHLSSWLSTFNHEKGLKVGLQYSNAIALGTLGLVAKVTWMSIKFLAIMITLPFAIMFFKNRE